MNLKDIDWVEVALRTVFIMICIAIGYALR